MFNAKTVDNFLSFEESNSILSFARSVEQWEGGGDHFWSNRCLNPEYIYNNYSKEIPTLMKTIKDRLGENLKSLYGLNEIYCDTFQIVRWFEGMEQPPHCDDMKDSEGTEGFHHREFGAIVYLNDNYEGGQTYYPNYNFYITPKSGTLAIHPGDIEHLHGVTKVTGSIRYTLASFWTSRKEFDHEWSIH